MKKIFFIAALTMICSQIDAQVEIGISGGYTNAWQNYGDVNLPEDAQIDVNGINLSLQLYYKFSPYVSVGIEPGFIEKGAACVPGWQPIFSGDTEFLLDYIEMPIMIGGHLPLLNDRIEMTAKLGMAGSYLVAGKRKEIYLNNDTPAEMFDIDLKDNTLLNRWDYGMQSGFGIGYNLGIHKIILECAYYHGLTNAEIWNTSQNRNVSYKVGYRIRL